MNSKKVIAICITAAVLLGGVSILTQDLFRNTPKMINHVQAKDPLSPAVFSDLIGWLRKPVIRSDGRKYQYHTIDARQVATEISAGVSLPVVGDRETLLKLLMDRGVLYNDTDNKLRGTDYGWYAVEDAAESVSMESGVGEAPMPMPNEAPDADRAAAGEANNAQGDGGSYSQTNEQVTGVNEGDIVKTDGRYIYAMSQSDNSLRIIKAAGDRLEIASKITYNDVWGAEFYLIRDDRLVIIGSEYVPVEAIPYGDEQANPNARSDAPMYRSASNDFTVLLIYDISDRTAPEQIRRVSMEGWQISTRVIGDIVYLATSKHMWSIPYDHADSPDILPYCRDTAEGEAYAPIGFDSIYYIPDTSDSSYLLVGAIDIYSDEAFEPQAYLGAGSSLYMSKNAMYITKYRWEAEESVADSWGPGSEKTDILRFAINGTSVAYTGMGTADGTPINQYSMDEYNGYFRIATTDWSVGTYVTVLDTADMRTVGRTEPLEPEEIMQSMRFMGNMGYVVTFRNMDPLFVIDLTNPGKPTVLGELKIPGFSQYLHPVGDGLLLGIGRDTQETYTRDANGVETVVGFQDIGMKASLFDVRNPFAPKEIDVLALGEGWTEVSYNPRAFMCDPSRNQYGFIVETWGNGGGSWWCQAVMLRVVNGQVSLAATLKPGVNISSYNSRLCFIGDILYMVHESGISVYDYNSFTQLIEFSF